MFATDPVIVAPVPLSNKLTNTFAQTAAQAACKAQDKESRVPNFNELVAMFVNMNIIGISSSENAFWSSTSATAGASGTAWHVYCGAGNSYPQTKTTAQNVWCVKK